MGEVGFNEERIDADGMRVYVRQEFGAFECYLGIGQGTGADDVDPDIRVCLSYDDIEALHGILSGMLCSRCCECQQPVNDGNFGARETEPWSVVCQDCMEEP